MTRKLATFVVAAMLCLGVVGPATAAVAPRAADQATTATSMPAGPKSNTWLLAVPAVTSLIAWATARLSVLSVVKAIY